MDNKDRMSELEILLNRDTFFFNKGVVDESKSYNTNNLQKAKYCQKTLLKDMERLRLASDSMELIVGKDFAAFPTYEDILYSVKY